MIHGTHRRASYLDLLQAYPPRPVKSEADREALQEIIDSLIDKEELTTDEEDYLEVLGTLAYEYDRLQETIPDIYGVDLLKVLMDEHELRQKDLVSIFKTESIVSDILKGRRKLTARHIEELARFFNLSPAVFFPEPTLSGVAK